MSADLAAYDVAYGATGALCLAMAVQRLVRIVRHRGDHLTGIVCFAFFSTAAAFLAAAPTVYLAVDDAVGTTDGATLVVYVCILLTSGAFLALLSAWTGQPGRRVATGLVGYAVVILAMVALFAAGHPEGAEHPVDFDARYADDPVLSRFLLLYYAGFALAVGATAWMSRHYAAMAERARPWLARGLRWTSWGASLAVLYCVLKVVAVVGIMRGAALEPLSTVWAPASATLGALLMAAGLSLPGWGPQSGDAVRRVLAYRRLYPLWRLLTDAVPAVVLEPVPSKWRPPWAGRWALRDSTHRLYRRAVEIHDARLALGPWLDPDGGALAPPGPDADPRRAEAAREAAVLVGAVQAKERGEPARPGHLPPREPGDEWGDQLDWLLAVARELRRAPAQVSAAMSGTGASGTVSGREG